MALAGDGAVSGRSRGGRGSGSVGVPAGLGLGLGLQVVHAVDHDDDAAVDGLAVLLVGVALQMGQSLNLGTLGDVGPGALAQSGGQELLNSDELAVALLVGAGAEVVLNSDGGLTFWEPSLLAKKTGSRVRRPVMETMLAGLVMVVTS